jgi:Bacterial Ig-like domain/Chitobiase/beta-hexosaminidase C-terminal domain
LRDGSSSLPTSTTRAWSPTRPFALPEAGHRGVGTHWVAVLLAVTNIASARWTVGGLGTAEARTATFDLVAAEPTVRATGQDVLISWNQSRLIGRWLGNHRAGGYQVRRYDASGDPQQMRTACSGRLAGPQATLGCVEHDVPEGTWQYAVTPILGGWTGIEGPRREVTVDAAALTVASPANGSTTRDRRPTLAGTASATHADLPRVTVTLSKRRFPGRAVQRLTTTALHGLWSVRPTRKLPEGVYTARARQADRAGRATWSRPSIFTIDTTAPTTASNTNTIGARWKQTAQTVTLRAVDPGGSGVATTYSTTDGSTPTTSSRQGNSVRLGEGIHIIQHFSVDKAGNSEAVRAAARPIRVDRTAPSTATLGPLPEVVRTDQMLTAGGDDALSGVARVVYEFCADVACATWTPIGSSTAGPAYSLAWRRQPADGSYQIRASVLDAAGNTTTSASQIIRVDNTSSKTTDAPSADDNDMVQAATR